MSKKNLTIFLNFFLYFALFTPKINGKPLNLPITQNSVTSILDTIRNDDDLCVSGKSFVDSHFSKICQNFDYPKDNVTFKSSNYEEFMCLGLYDRIYRLCHLDTLRAPKKTILPKDAAQFDRSVQERLPKDGEGILDFCQKWKNIYPPKYVKTERYVAQLEKVIGEPALCVKYCTADDASVVPLCVVLSTMDDMSEATANGAQSNEENSQSKVVDNEQIGQSQVAVDSEAKTASKDSKKAEDSKVHSETTLVASQPQKSSETQKAEISSDKISAELSEKLPEAVKTDLKKQEETSRVSSATQVGKIDDNAQVSGAHSDNFTPESKVKETTKQNDEKKDESATGGSEKNVEASKGLKADETPLEPPAAAVDGPAGAAAIPPSSDGSLLNQREGISGEDISGEDFPGIVDAAKLGSISQNTQGDPETELGGADGVDPAAVEPPALVGEDSEQSPVQPSEKREFIPHMRTPNEDDSHFFGYFTVIGVMCIAGYVGYHNKQKILAMVLEGRRSRGGRNRRRPSTANYRKLDCTLEEAVTSQCNSNVTHVIY